MDVEIHDNTNQQLQDRIDVLNFVIEVEMVPANVSAWTTDGAADFHHERYINML